MSSRHRRLWRKDKLRIAHDVHNLIASIYTPSSQPPCAQCPISPVIVNTILNEHQIVVDIVAFVNKGDFPRSRLGEKQRGKILATWVTRKMRTMAQFGIRDPDSALPDVMEQAEPRNGAASLRTGASSLRHVEQAPQIVEEQLISQQEADRQMAQQLQEEFSKQPQGSFSPPAGYAEMPAGNYEEEEEEEKAEDEVGDELEIEDDDTPTRTTPSHFELPTVIQPTNPEEEEEIFDPALYTTFTTTSQPIQSPPPPQPAQPPSRTGPKPFINYNPTFEDPLPSIDGRASAIYDLPSQRVAGGGLRIHNPDNDEDGDEGEWPEEAIMHMNLAGNGYGHSRSGSRETN
jgi:hypothetical protein